MNKKTIEAMVKLAYKSGICKINYAGTESGGLYSSSNSAIILYVAKYPGDAKCYKRLERDAKIKMPDHLDSITVHDGFIEIKIGRITDVEREYVSSWDTSEYRSGQLRYQHVSLGKVSFPYPTPEEDKANRDYQCADHTFKTMLIPFDKIISIVF